MQQTIFVVEDDDNIREMLLYAMKTAGYEAKGFENGDEIFKAFRETLPAMILLDIMLPGSDGMQILKRLRQAERYRQIPVIMITAKGEEMDRIQGLDAGADDYITKPFSVMEVISRIKAVLRRYDASFPAEEEKREELTQGDIRLHPSKRQVTVAGEEVVLTYKEFELLQCLMLNKELVLSRDKLLEDVWGFDYNGESRTVDMHIKSLRKKLGKAGNEIKTVRNVGYKIGG